MYIAYVGRALPTTRRDDGDVYLVSSIDKGETWSRARLASTTTTARRSSSSRRWRSTRRRRPRDVGRHARRPGADALRHLLHPLGLDHGRDVGLRGQDTGHHHPQHAGSRTSRPTPTAGFPNGLFLGDYFSIRAASADDVYMVWADTRLGEYGAPNQKIGFARRKAVPGTGGLPVAQRPGPAVSR